MIDQDHAVEPVDVAREVGRGGLEPDPAVHAGMPTIGRSADPAPRRRRRRRLRSGGREAGPDRGSRASCLPVRFVAAMRQPSDRHSRTGRCIPRATNHIVRRRTRDACCVKRTPRRARNPVRHNTEAPGMDDQPFRPFETDLDESRARSSCCARRWPAATTANCSSNGGAPRCCRSTTAACAPRATTPPRASACAPCAARPRATPIPPRSPRRR